jgi:hypothetical protein
MNGNNFRKSNEKGSQFIEMRRRKRPSRPANGHGTK